MSVKKCVLDGRKICDDCGECDYCDLNPFKICDNCGRCIGLDEEFREIKIDDVVINGESKKSKLKARGCDCCGHEHHEHCEHDY